MVPVAGNSRRRGRAAAGRTSALTRLLGACAAAAVAVLASGLPAAAEDAAAEETVAADPAPVVVPAEPVVAEPAVATTPVAPAPVSEPAVTSVAVAATDESEPAPDPATEPATEPAPEPAPDPTPDPSTEPAPEPATEPATEPSTPPDTPEPSPVPDPDLLGSGTEDDDLPVAGGAEAANAPVLPSVTTTPSSPTSTTAIPGSTATTASPTAGTSATPLTEIPSAFPLAGWSNPAQGRITSVFGLRVHPVLGTVGQHAGTDVAARCGTPVSAAASGVVVYVGIGYQGRTGNQVVIAHGNGVITRYGHLLSGTTRVAIGDRVGAGQPIAAVGGNPAIDPVGAGNSTGCHLHFEVNLRDGALPVDPGAFLLDRGVRLGVDPPQTVVTLAALLDAAAPAAAEALAQGTDPALEPALEAPLVVELARFAVHGTRLLLAV